MRNAREEFIKTYMDRCKDVPIITVITEIYDHHFVEQPKVKNKDNFLELMLPISKEEAAQLDRTKYEEEYVIRLCNKLIPKINGIVTVNYDEIKEKSKLSYPFELFSWSALDEEFTSSKKELQEKAISTLTEMYVKEGIKIKILCEHTFRRISIVFI